MSDFTTDTQDIIKQLRNETLKEYRVYDVTTKRLTDIYQAPTKAQEGHPCLRTQQTFDGDSNRIQKKKETVVAWQAAWDI